MYRYFIKPLFFLFEPEKIHDLVIWFLQKPAIIFIIKLVLPKQKFYRPTQVWDIHFKNPIGLAAGFDKNARAIDAWEALGFGFVEIGTVTPLPQKGNDKPRLFRLPEDEAIINRMGFNNDGVDTVVERLKNRKSSIVVGGNIGKNKTTPNEHAVQDYLTCLEKLYLYVDYFVINVSSPNTPDLRALQEKEPLTKIISMLQERRMQLSESKNLPLKPILLKIAPDLSTTQIDDIIDICSLLQLDGLVISNTTIARDHLKTPLKTISRIGYGGLSGKPLEKKATELLTYIHKKIPHLPIIGVGGIHSGFDAYKKKEAGARLVQLYTGFIYEGPRLITEILRRW